MCLAASFVSDWCPTLSACFPKSSTTLIIIIIIIIDINNTKFGFLNLTLY